MAAMAMPCGAVPSRRLQHEPLCEALRARLPNHCVVGPECFGFVCLEDMFGTALSVEVDLEGVCLPEQHILLAVERPFEQAEAAAANGTTLAVARSSTAEAVARPSAAEAEGCYDIVVHQCDCTIPDAAACQALNDPEQPPRFFWTSGCSSCAEEREWGFEFVAGPPTNYSRRMSGLQYDVPRCENPDGAGGFAVGQFRSAGGEGNVLISLGLDACCADSRQAGSRGDELASILVAARLANASAPALDTSQELEGCYDISVHRCDCGVPDQATCNALNVPNQPQRFFWTAGCASCAGRDACGAELDTMLPNMILDEFVFDFGDACNRRK